MPRNRDTTPARTEHLRRAAERNLDNPNAVARSVRITRAALDRGLITPEDLGLPPFTPDQVAEAGALAAKLDARRSS